MDTYLSKEKKQEILDLLTNYNNLSSESDFGEIREILHEACKEGDVELIKIYLNETITNDSKEITFKIDKTNQTASLFKVSHYIEELIIPRTVKHETIEYLITSICIGDNIKTIKFSEDSAVKTFYRNSHNISEKITEIYFPSSLEKLKDGWCDSLNKLTKIIISPLNDKFLFKDNKILFGKYQNNFIICIPQLFILGKS